MIAKNNAKNFKSVVAVITTFNRLKKLKVTVKNTLKQNFAGVVIVNNCSTDGTKKWLDGLEKLATKKTSTQIEVIHLKDNLGGAGGVHYGFKAAVKNFKAQWLVCYDDDAYPKANMLDNFQKLDLDDNVGGVCAAVYLPDGEISEFNRPSIDPFKKGFMALVKGSFSRASYHVKDSDYNQPHKMIEVDYCSFVGCFIRMENIKKGLGYPEKDFFIYADDIAYTHKLSAMGKKLIFAPQLEFIHDQARKNNLNLLPLWRVFYFIRNNLFFYKRISGKLYPLIICYKVCIWLVKFYKYAFNWRFYYVLWCAVIDGVLGRVKRKHNKIMQMGGVLKSK